MEYKQSNVVRQFENYIGIRKASPEAENVSNDIYVRDPDRNIWWFVGKVARCSGVVTLAQAVARQWNLIEEHACRLRPIELGRKFGSLEVWTAPIDSEMQMENNDDSIQLQKMERTVAGVENVQSIEVGLNLEIVTSRGEGFRVERKPDGTCS